MTTTGDRPTRTRNLPPVPGLHDPLPLTERSEFPEDRVALVRARMAERISEIHDQANGDQEALLRMFAEEIALASGWASMMEEHRDAAAARLRDKGMPMTRIAKLARVSDSYLARRLFKRGVTRKVVRGGVLAVVVIAALNAIVSLGSPDLDVPRAHDEHVTWVDLP